MLVLKGSLSFIKNLIFLVCVNFTIRCDINQRRPPHSCENRNPEETWIPPYQVRGRLGQALNDRMHKTYVVMYKNPLNHFPITQYSIIPLFQHSNLFYLDNKYEFI
jgi:hypothetical protein